MQTTRTRLEEITLFLLANPQHWTHWPVLPMKRLKPGGELLLGLVFDTRRMELPGFSSTVFLCNLLELPDMSVVEHHELPREVFDSSEELVDAGWRVD